MARKMTTTGGLLSRAETNCFAQSAERPRTSRRYVIDVLADRKKRTLDCRFPRSIFRRSHRRRRASKNGRPFETRETNLRVAEIRASAEWKIGPRRVFGARQHVGCSFNIR